MRSSYYGSNPNITDVVFDGIDLVNEYEPTKFRERFEQSIDAAKVILPKFALVLDAQASVSSGTVDLRIIPCADIPNKDIDVFLCILEDSLDSWFGVHRRVVRDLYQFPLSIALTDTFDTMITFSHEFSVPRMSAVIFIQDLSTKEIMQTITSTFD